MELARIGKARGAQFGNRIDALTSVIPLHRNGRVGAERGHFHVDIARRGARGYFGPPCAPPRPSSGGKLHGPTGAATAADGLSTRQPALLSPHRMLPRDLTGVRKGISSPIPLVWHGGAKPAGRPRLPSRQRFQLCRGRRGQMARRPQYQTPCGAPRCV